MSQTPLRKPGLSYGLAGMACGIIPIVGWFAVKSMVDSESAEQALFAYLLLGPLITFSVAAAYIGRLREKVRLLAERDDLTGLLNQNAFLRTTRFLLQLAIRHKEPVAILMMDIDHFKTVNDQHNHLVGSHVLKELAKICESSTRKSDLVARFGGDEYIFCLPRTNPTDAKIVAERIRGAVEGRSFTLRNHSVKVTVSIGIASATGDKNLDLDQLIETADQALYQAKDEGRNKVVVRTMGA